MNRKYILLILYLVIGYFFYLKIKEIYIHKQLIIGYELLLKGNQKECKKKFMNTFYYDKNNYKTLLNLGKFNYKIGNFDEAFKFLSKAYLLNSNNSEIILYFGCLLLGLGKFDESIKVFKSNPKLIPDYYYFKMDVVAEKIRDSNNIVGFNNDLWLRSKKQNLKNNPKLKDSINNFNFKKINTYSKKFEPLIQIKSSGFLKNYRQWCMFGVNIVYIAQELIKNNTFMKITNLSVLWRQISDPVTPVLWNYLQNYILKEVSFTCTFLILGDYKTPKYYPYFDKIFKKTKDALINNLDDKFKNKINNCNDISELYNIFKKNIEIKTQVNYKEINLIGPKIEVGMIENKLSLYITTFLDLEKNKKFNKIMYQVLEELKQSLDKKNINDIIYHSCKVFYYWIKWTPLTRGSAVIGYELFYGCLLAGGIIVNKGPPENIQIDFEIYLSNTPEEFYNKITLLWLEKEDVLDINQKKNLNELSNIPNILTNINSIKKIIIYLNKFTRKN